MQKGQQPSFASCWPKDSYYGGDERDRTVDLLSARQALSQLSYVPTATGIVSKSAYRIPMRRVVEHPVTLTSSPKKLLASAGGATSTGRTTTLAVAESHPDHVEGVRHGMAGDVVGDGRGLFFLRVRLFHRGRVVGRVF